MEDSSMTYDEMSKFTHEELSCFSHLELSLEQTELIKTIVNDFRDDIPSSVIIKLERICQNFISSCEQNNIEIPSEITELKNKKHLSILDILSVLGTIITIISFVMGIFSSDDRTVHNTYTNQITNYVITEKYITNIYDINNELKQTYDISIDTDSTPNDSNTDD
jgi:hypothetical protein